MGKNESESRDFVMARLLAARAAAASAVAAIDELAALFLDPADDKSGSQRKDLLEEADASMGVGAQLVQQAMEAFPDIDPKEAEDLDDEDEQEEDEDDDEDDERPRRRARK